LLDGLAKVVIAKGLVAALGVRTKGLLIASGTLLGSVPDLHAGTLARVAGIATADEISLKNREQLDKMNLRMRLPIADQSWSLHR